MKSKGWMSRTGFTFSLSKEITIISGYYTGTVQEKSAHRVRNSRGSILNWKCGSDLWFELVYSHSYNRQFYNGVLRKPSRSRRTCYLAITLRTTLWQLETHIASCACSSRSLHRCLHGRMPWNPSVADREKVDAVMLLVRGDFKDACEKVYTTLICLYCGTSFR